MQLSADCGTTPRVFALPGAFSVASDCRDSTTPPAPALPYDHRIYASAAAARLAGDGPTLMAGTSARIDYFDLRRKGDGTGSTGASPANSNGQAESSARLVFDIDGAQPGDVYTLRTQLYVGGNWAFSTLGDPYASFVDGYLQVRGDWSGNFGVVVDGIDSPPVLYQLRGTGIEGGGSLVNGIVTLERTIRAGEIQVLRISTLADAYMKNNFGTQDQNGQIGIGSGSFDIGLEAGVVDFQVFDANSTALAANGSVSLMNPVAFTVTTDAGAPFVYYTAPVPELQTLTMMLAGMAVLGGVARRRRLRRA
ncbi:MAG: hypothetical protein H6932_08065 [Burkholderiaceae bacterium]|nr:hypothetical protein [Burkholderiaceae bacterium]